MDNLTIGFALTGSFCTHADMLHQIRRLKEDGANIVPIVSTHAGSMDTRFGTAPGFEEADFEITGVEPLDTIVLTEPFGPKSSWTHLLLPMHRKHAGKACQRDYGYAGHDGGQGASAKRTAAGACHCHNDGLSGNRPEHRRAIAKNVYFVPFGQDDPVHKPSSLVSHPELISETVQAALRGKQLQPVLRHW